LTRQVKHIRKSCNGKLFAAGNRGKQYFDKKGNKMFCPFCKSGNLVESQESMVDYFEVGDTYRCKDCGYGFGFTLNPEPGEWKEI